MSQTQGHLGFSAAVVGEEGQGRLIHKETRTMQDITHYNRDLRAQRFEASRGKTRITQPSSSPCVRLDSGIGKASGPPLGRQKTESSC